MNFASLLDRFTSPSSDKKHLRIVIQVDGVYLSTSSSEQEEPLVIPIESSWEPALESAVQKLSLGRCYATVVLSSKYYQSFQIDKPELPKEEWSVALPFLLKDLLTERVTDIVADASLLSDGKRVQAYVLSKSILNPLIQLLAKNNITLTRVLPEEEVWGYSQTEQSSFMLLYRGLKDSYKLSAFVDGSSRFQRVIRGVVSPLTGVASSELQLDSIALELQRSSDYLSSQMRDAVFNRLYVCCDEDNSTELASALSERLSIKVSSLFGEDEGQLCGQVLCQNLALVPAKGINLYPPHLKPKKELFTLTSVAASWGLVALLMGGYYGYLSYELQSVESELNKHSRTKEQLTAQFENLSNEFVNYKPTPAKLTAAERLKEDIATKRATLDAVGRFDDSLKEGYSGVMASLAELGRSDISISYIKLNDGALSLSGLARTPSSVPKWVKQFKTELNLVGRTFKSLNIGRNDTGVVTFELTTEVDTLPAPAGGE